MAKDSTITVILQVAALVGILVALGYAAWQLRLYLRLNENEKLIRAKEDEIDAIEPDVNARTSGHLVNEKQRLAQVEKAKPPLMRELERLQQERRFILDKLLFAKK